MSGARYAIFFVPPPDSALYHFGASALGYDSYSGHKVPSLSDDDVGAAEWQQLTAEPQRCGFHATLKAPFSLRDEYSEADLIAGFAQFAEGLMSPPAFAATIRLLDGFAALVPSTPAPALNLLVDKCVRDFERFRRPLNEAERARRLTQKLTPRQIGHVDRWGYPYVFEDFRFHMTLTGRLPAEQTLPALRLLHKTLQRQPVLAMVVVETIALLRQDRADASFRVIQEIALRNAAGSLTTDLGQDAEVAPKPDAFGGDTLNFTAGDRIAARR
jgi:hypothetical protein